jgi:acetyl esterase/lipase
LPPLPVFTDEDRDELRRACRWLDRLPRVRVQGTLGRVLSQGVVLTLETLTAPRVRRTGVEVEVRSVVALGRRIGLRILRPPGKLRGVHLDFHGGGWCTGNARMNDLPNAELASTCGVAVISVDYGLAPRTSLKDMLSQCEAAAVWLAENAKREFGSTRMTIGGESAGAHLAVCTVLRRRLLFHAALLYYGLYDLSGSEALRCAPASTLVVHVPTALSSLNQLTPKMTDAERRAPDISPAFADLAGLPPVLFIAGTADPLLAESEALRARWKEANGNADILIVPEAPHAFNRLPVAVARKTDAYARAWLSDYFSAASQ